MIGMFRIARREYLQLVKSLGFVVLVLLLPFIAMLGFAIPKLLQSTEPTRLITIIDQTGEYEAGLRRSFNDMQRERIVSAWDGWVRIGVLQEAYDDASINPLFLPDPLSAARRDEAEVLAFDEAGGIEAAKEAVVKYIKPKMPAFVPPRASIQIVPAPFDVDTGAPFEEIGEALTPYVLKDKPYMLDGNEKHLFAAILIKPGTEVSENSAGALNKITPPIVHYWSGNIAIITIPLRIEAEITNILKFNAYEGQGVPLELVRQVNLLSLQMKNYQPEFDGTDSAVSLEDRLERFLPMVFAYLLFVSAFSVGNLLLTSVIEEKSNKIVEVLLSSVTAHQLMAGKLLGVGAMSMTAISIWLLMGLGAVFAFTGDLSMLFNAFDLLMANGLLPWFLLFYVLGYFMFASIFLAVGSLSQSIQDAQTFLGPISMVLLLPMPAFLFVIRDPTGMVAKVLTWIPLYTPYALLLRISSNLPKAELYSATALLVMSSMGMVWLMGRIFHQSILNAGQPPKWREIFRLMRK